MKATGSREAKTGEKRVLESQSTRMSMSAMRVSPCSESYEDAEGPTE